MPTNFPASQDNFPNPTPTTPRNSAGDLGHAQQHININDAVESIENYLLTGVQGDTNLLFNGDFVLPTQDGATSGYGGLAEGWTAVSTNAIQAGQPSPLTQSTSSLASQLGISSTNFLGLWDFSQGLTDLSGNGNTLTPVNAPTTTSDGLWGTAYSFVRASSQRLQTATINNLAPTTSQTWFVVCKPNGTSLTAGGAIDTANAWVMANYGTAGNGAGIHFRKVSTVITEALKSQVNVVVGSIDTVGAIGSAKVNASPFTQDADSWMFIAMSFDDTANTLTTMVNGQVFTSPATGTATAAGTDRRLAFGNAGQLTAQQYHYHGLIQGGGMLNVALSVQQLKQLWRMMMYSGMKTRRSGTDGYIQNTLNRSMLPLALGQTVQASVDVFAPATTDCELRIVDGAGTTLASAAPTAAGSWQTIRCSATAPSSTTDLSIRLVHRTNNSTAYWRRCQLSLGNRVVPFSYSRQDHGVFPGLLNLDPPQAYDGYRYGTLATEDYSVSRMINQSIPGTTWTAVLYDTVNWLKSNGAASYNTVTGQITVGRTGFYQISIRNAVVAAGVGLIAIDLLRGGTVKATNSIEEIQIFSGSVNSGANPTSVVGHGKVWLKAGDLISSAVFQSAGGANNLIANSTNSETSMSLMRLYSIPLQ